MWSQASSITFSILWKFAISRIQQVRSNAIQMRRYPSLERVIFHQVRVHIF